MIPLYNSRNWLGYYLWRWLLRSNGAFISWLDYHFFGQSRGLNDYDTLAPKYNDSDVKPDKQYSILPTVLQMIGKYSSKTVLDFGCGSGFFTVPIAKKGVLHVCGIDNSRRQIDLARLYSAHSHTSYYVGDIFGQSWNPVDLVVAPFVVNYARTTSVLKYFFQLVYNSLNDDGKAIFVVDIPNGKHLEKFGAKKSLLGKRVDETSIQIDLYNNNARICTLYGVFYTRATIESLLLTIGFQRVVWTKPIVTKKGINTFGTKFWRGYVDDPELGYLTAYK